MRDKSKRFDYQCLVATGWEAVAFADLKRGDVFRMREKSDGKNLKRTNLTQKEIDGGGPSTKAGQAPVGYVDAYFVEREPHRLKLLAVEKINPQLKGKKEVIEMKGIPCPPNDPDADPRSSVCVSARCATAGEQATARTRTAAERDIQTADRLELERLQLLYG